MNQFLSQEEVDALLRGISGGDVATEQDTVEGANHVRTYDLTNQERIIRGRMPTLEIINQKFARLLRASLSGSLRRVIDVSAQNVEMIKFGEFLKTLPVPTSMHIIRMNPLRGGALLVIDSKLVFALIDSFFGGPGSSNVKIEGRDFTSIETHMIQRLVDIVFYDMEKAWEAIEPISIEQERSEVNPQFVGIVPPSDVVVITPFEVEMDEAHGAITCCLPYSTIEPIRAKLYTGFQTERLEVDQSWLRRITHQLENLEVELSVEFGSTDISLRNILSLQVGDIIRLDQDYDAPLLVKVEGVPKFTGFPRVMRQKKAVEISTKLRPVFVEDESDE
ncbi:MAG: flagellar motor switch protein FliM [Candidatus Tectimicrobiota bacterium]